MSGISKPAFTLLELLVAMALIGIMATFIVPNLQKSQPGYERKSFFARLSALTQYGKQHAMVSNKTYQILFDFNKNIVQLLQEGSGQKDSSGNVTYEPVQSMAINTIIPLPESLEIKNFYIDGSGFDEMAKFVGRKTGQVWFFMVPEGLAQETIINMLDTKDIMYDGKPRQFALVLNPFTVQFKEYDTFQK